MRTRFLIPFLMVLAVGCEPTDEPAPDAPENGEAATTQAPDEAGDTAQTAEPAAETGMDACELVMGWDPWEPYHFTGTGGDVRGLDIDLVTAMAERADCELDFLQGNWASLLRLIRSGELDLLAGATRTSDREAYGRFSKPYREESFSLYVRADETGQWSDSGLETLLADGFRLGVTQGYLYSDEISELQANPDYSEQFIEGVVSEINFANLLDYRIDGFLEDPFVASAIDRRRDWGTGITALAEGFGSGQVRLLFSRESVSQDVVERFNEALEQMRESGEYERIVDRYMDPGLQISDDETGSD